MNTRVGPMIAAIAAAKGVTHAELAELVGVHRNRFSDKLRGKAPFREAEIVTLAEFFGVNPGQLFQDPLELLGVSEGSSSACTRILKRIFPRERLFEQPRWTWDNAA